MQRSLYTDSFFDFFVWFIFWFSFDLDCALAGQRGFQTDFGVRVSVRASVRVNFLPSPPSHPHTLMDKSWIVRPVSLRPQNEGQKKLTDRTDAHGVFDHGFFLTFVFWFISGFHTDLQAWPLAAAVIQIVVWYAAILHKYIAQRKASAAHVQDSCYSCD